MISEDLLKLMVCPEDHTPLAHAEAALVARVNQAVAEGRLRNRSGRIVERTIEGGLLRADGRLLYPVVDDLPIMLIDEAIPLEQLTS